MKYALLLNRNFKSKMTSESKKRLGIVWFRNDLRLTDNLTLNKSIEFLKQKKLDLILPFYCFDKLLFEGKSRQAGLPKLGPYRRNFLIESVLNLKENLTKKLSSDLYLTYGEQDVEIKNLIEKINLNHANIQIDSVFAMKEIPCEEIEVENKVKAILDEKKIHLHLVWDNTMIHLDDLPFNNVSQVPDMFTQFRKKTELRGDSNHDVRRPVYLPSNGFVLNLFRPEENFGLEKCPPKVDNLANSNRSAIEGMKGGEDAAEARMVNYFSKAKVLLNIKQLEMA